MRIAVFGEDQLYINTILEHIKLYFFENATQYELVVFSNYDDVKEYNRKIDIAFISTKSENIFINKISTNFFINNKDIVITIISDAQSHLDDVIDVNIFRFLTKPINSKKLYLAIKDSVNKIQLSSSDIYTELNNSVEKLKDSNIILVEICGKQTKVVTTTQEFDSPNPISYWSDALSKPCFISPHKSFIINMFFVTEYKKDCFVLNDKYTVPISQRKSPQCKELIFQFAKTNKKYQKYLFNKNSNKNK